MAPAPVLEAIQEWHRAFRPDWTFTPAQDGATVEVLMEHPLNPAAMGSATIFGTETTRLRAVVRIDPLAVSFLKSTALHELGHVAGLEHNEWTRLSAMHESPVDDRYFVSDLVAMAVARRHCRTMPVAPLVSTAAVLASAS